MGLIFEKVSGNRARQYQIKTVIVDEAGTKRAYKEALRPEGALHIQSMIENYDLLKSVSDYCYVVPQVVGQKVYFEYAEGETLAQKLLFATAEGNNEEAGRCLKQFAKCAKQSKGNECRFEITPAFEAVFGNSFSELNGIKGIRVADIDVNLDNIITSDGVLKLIDYEWVFNFPVPLDYVLYRNLNEFYMKNESVLKNRMGLSEALDLLGVTTERDVLDNLENGFREFVSGGAEIYPKNRYRQAIYYADRDKDGSVLGFLQKEIDRLNHMAIDFETLKAEYHATIQGLMEKLAGKEQELAGKEQELAEAKRKLMETEQKLMEYRTELEKIFASKSWKFIQTFSRTKKT